ncbi:MAG: ABC transporter permease [Candidatus Promineifilaceae bacterium]
MRTISAFLKRDLLSETSYRLSFVLSIGSVIFNVLVFYFLSVFIEDVSAPSLAIDAQDYFSFVLIGVAFSGYFSVGLNGFSRAIRDAQVSGTLEAMLMTPASLPAIVVGSAAWSYVFTTFRVVTYLLVGMAISGLRFTDANYLAAIAGLCLSVVSFASIGIIAAAIIMVIKRGNPVTAVFGAIANLVSGVFYPVEVLPAWLQTVARLVPLTYALSLMRGALLEGATWSQLSSDFLALAAFCVALFPLSLFIFRAAVRRARLEGTLTHY